MRIGPVLEQARSRAGLEIADVEEQTKIRAKYLRALESEDWGELPSSAYAKGFLRTYAQLLGLDADALVDEYRRQVESELDEPSYPLGDQVLERRRRRGPMSRGRPRWVLVLVLLLLIGGGVAAAVLITQRQRRQPEEGRQARQERAQATASTTTATAAATRRGPWRWSCTCTSRSRSACSGAGERP